MSSSPDEAGPRTPGTYRTAEGGIEVIVDVPESASYVEDMWPDEVAYLREQAATEARRELLAKVEGLPHDKEYHRQHGVEMVERAAVLALLAPSEKGARG